MKKEIIVIYTPEDFETDSLDFEVPGFEVIVIVEPGRSEILVDVFYRDNI
jgi:hypothetical protein